MNDLIVHAVKRNWCCLYLGVEQDCTVYAVSSVKQFLALPAIVVHNNLERFCLVHAASNHARFLALYGNPTGNGIEQFLAPHSVALHADVDGITFGSCSCSYSFKV